MGQRRAQRGGERGVNGEWYGGGKFLPETNSAKGSAKGPRVRRVEIEPGIWADAADGRVSLWGAIKALVDHVARQANPGAPLVPIQNTAAIEYYGGQEVLDRIAAYNSGKRWI